MYFKLIYMYTVPESGLNAKCLLASYNELFIAILLHGRLLLSHCLITDLSMRFIDQALQLEHVYFKADRST